MSRIERTELRGVLDRPADFNQQMYEALRSAPWWMMSIGFHVFIFVLSTLFQSDKPALAATAPMATSMMPSDPPAELEPPVEPDEVEQIHQTDTQAKEPSVKDAEISDHVETDNDMQTDEAFGESGLSDAPWDGVANNGLIGLSGGRGGAFGGRGGNQNLTTGRGGKIPVDALEDALRWLAAHQSPDGGWEAEGWRKRCLRRPNPRFLPRRFRPTKYSE